MTDDKSDDCAWCGAEIRPCLYPVPMSSRGERFCTRAHRDASARAVRRLHESCDQHKTTGGSHD